MKKPILILLFILFAPALQAQLINMGVVYGMKSWQRAYQSYTDHAGNRYTTVWFFGDGWDPNNENLYLDSAGFSVAIPPNSGSSQYVILKYDSNGRYQHYFQLKYFGGSGNIEQPKLCFDAQNNIFFYFPLTKGDSSGLFNADGSLFKYIKSSAADSSINASGVRAQYGLLLASVNSQGQYQWVARVENKSPFHYSHNRYYRGQFDWSQRFFTNSNNEVIVQYNNFWYGHLHNNDTLLFTDIQGQQSDLPVSSREVVFTFSPSGQLLKYREPFKNRLGTSLPDTSAEGYYRSVTDGVNTYSIYRFNVNGPDTFHCNTPVALFKGLNYILFKTNAQDEVVWARSLGVDQYTYPEHHFHLDYSAHRRQLVVGFAYGPGVFRFINNPALNGTSLYTDLYVSAYDTSGAVVWEKTYGGTSHETMQSLTYNHKNNQLTMIGTTQSDDLALGKYVLRANSGAGSRVYVAAIDSNNEVYLAQLINSFSAELFPSDIGYPVTDHKGRTHISGWFSDSIKLACNNTLRATRWFNDFGFQAHDGFVLTITPHVLVDTAVCRSLVSPSGRYVWDSAAVYHDTIPDVAGCDSVLLFRVKILSSKSRIDTAVCKQFTSLSRRYRYDSSGTYLDTIPNAKGCDSLVTIVLTMLHSKSSIDSTVKVNMVSLSRKYLWNSSGTYSDTIKNVRGCDSIITVRLKVLQTKSTIDTAVCREFRSPSGKYLYTLPGIYRDTIPNLLGGDSMMTIQVRLLNSSSTIDTSSCIPYKSPRGTLFNLSGTYYDTIPNRAGCDSVIRINYSRPEMNSSITKYACLAYGSPSGKYTYSTTGFYTDTLQTPDGCDSIITIHFILIPLELRVSKSNDINCATPHAQLLVTGGSEYMWRPSTGLSDAAISNPIAKPDSTTLYRIDVKDSLGCAAVDSILLVVTKEPEIRELANVFTPNNDGLNDCLHINDVAGFKKVELLIFNRWGTVVFKSQNPNDCWNGNDPSGNALNAGVYFFVLQGTSNCEEDIEQHGTITLIR